MDPAKLNATLDAVDKTVEALVPIVGTIGSLSRLIVGLAKKQGLDTTTFEAEIAKFDGQIGVLNAARAEFWQKYPRTAQPGQPSQPGGGDPSGPAPGSTQTIGE